MSALEFRFDESMPWGYEETATQVLGKYFLVKEGSFCVFIGYAAPQQNYSTYADTFDRVVSTFRRTL